MTIWTTELFQYRFLIFQVKQLYLGLWRLSSNKSIHSYVELNIRIKAFTFMKTEWKDSFDSTESCIESIRTGQGATKNCQKSAASPERLAYKCCRSFHDYTEEEKVLFLFITMGYLMMFSFRRIRVKRKTSFRMSTSRDEALKYYLQSLA